MTGEIINNYRRDLGEVNLRFSENNVSWLARKINYHKVRKLIGEGKFVFMLGDLFGGGVEEVQGHLRTKGLKISTLYISNVPTYAHPSQSQLDFLQMTTSALKMQGVYVTDGSKGRGGTFRTYNSSLSH